MAFISALRVSLVNKTSAVSGLRQSYMKRRKRLRPANIPAIQAIDAHDVYFRTWRILVNKTSVILDLPFSMASSIELRRLIRTLLLAVSPEVDGAEHAVTAWHRFLLPEAAQESAEPCSYFRALEPGWPADAKDLLSHPTS